MTESLSEILDRIKADMAAATTTFPKGDVIPNAMIKVRRHHLERLLKIAGDGSRTLPSPAPKEHSMYHPTVERLWREIASLSLDEFLELSDYLRSYTHPAHDLTPEEEYHLAGHDLDHGTTIDPEIAVEIVRADEP